MPDRDRYSESGDTLIEVLLALVVLALASLALLIAFSTSISSSAEHRQLATYNTVLATATQVTIANIQAQPSLFSCPPNLSAYPGYIGGITLPAPYTGKYTVDYAVVNPVQYWNPALEAFGNTCEPNQPQLITIYIPGTNDTNSFVVDYPIGSSNALTPGAAAQLVFLKQPVGGYAGSPFTTQPVIEIETAGGSPSAVTTDLSPVILTLTQGTGVLSSCSGNEILGVVTFSGCTIGTGGSNFEITASDGTLTPAVSDPFSVSSSSYHLVFQSQPVAAASGAAFATAPVIAVQNSSNVTDTSWAGTITLTLSGGALSALPSQTCAFTNATTITLTPVNGIVTMPSGCAFSGGYYYDASRNPPQTATQYTMMATANPNAPTDAAVPATSNTFSVTSFGTATQIAFTVQPTGVASATAATPFSGQPTLAVEDAFGNVVTTANNPLALSINSGGQGITLSNCNTPSPSVAGLYVFSGCEGSNWGTQLTLTATSSGLTSATSSTFNITNVASQLLFTTQPVAGDSGSILAIEPVLTVEDSANRVVTAATTPIAFNAAVPASGTLSSCTSLVPQSGVVSVANCVFAGVVGTPYTIVATSGALTSAPSSSFSPTGPGPASQLVFTTSPVAGVSGTAFATQPIVKVEDSAGNTVTSSTAVISLTSSGGTLAACSGLTASAGVVTVSNCTFAGVVGTQYTLTASSGPLTSPASSNFSPTYAGVPSQIIVTGCSTPLVTPTACVASATLEDVYGNIETHDNSSVVTFSQVSGSGSVTGLGSSTVSSGLTSDTVAGAAQGLVGIAASGDSLPSNTITVTVNAPSTTALTSSSNPSVSGQTVTYTATVSVTSPDIGVPTGNIEFLDNGTAIATCGGAGGAADNGAGQATCAVAWPTVSTQTIAATYLGNAGTYYLASTSSSLTQTVNKASTTTGVASSSNPSVSGQTVTYTATVSVTAPGSGTPTGNVKFLDGGVAIATCGGAGGVAVNGSAQATCAVTYANTTGSPHSITTVYLGDANFNTSTSSTLTQTVNKASTATGVASSSNPSVSGQTVTYTATVSVTVPGSGTPTGNVEFLDGGVAIATCGGAGGVAVNGSAQATCAVTYVNPTGSPHSISTVYLGSAVYITSTSSVLTQTVNKASTTIGVVSNLNPSVPSQTVTYTATVSVTAPGSGTPTGNVEFLDGGTSIATCGGAGGVAVNGSAQAACAVTYANTTGSPHSITAVYLGSAVYLTSTSSVLTQTVNKAATTTGVVSSLNPSIPSQTVTYTGTVTVTAPGTGTPPGNIEFLDGGVAIATCGGAGGVAVNGSAQATCAVTYANTTGSPHSITADYLGSANYNTSTSSTLTQTVNKASTTTGVVSSLNPSTTSQLVTYTGTVTVTAPGTGTPTGNMEFLNGGVAIAGCGGAGGVAVNGSAIATCAVTWNAVGSLSITAQYLGGRQLQHVDVFDAHPDREQGIAVNHLDPVGQYDQRGSASPWHIFVDRSFQCRWRHRYVHLLHRQCLHTQPGDRRFRHDRHQ